MTTDDSICRSTKATSSKRDASSARKSASDARPPRVASSASSASTSISTACPTGSAASAARMPSASIACRSACTCECSVGAARRVAWAWDSTKAITSSAPASCSRASPDERFASARRMDFAPCSAPADRMARSIRSTSCDLPGRPDNVKFDFSQSSRSRQYRSSATRSYHRMIAAAALVVESFQPVSSRTLICARSRSAHAACRQSIQRNQRDRPHTSAQPLDNLLSNRDRLFFQRDRLHDRQR